MARGILDIAIEAAERRNTAPAPSTLFGTNNKTAKLLRVAAKDTLRDILTRTNWTGVSELQSTWVFAVRPGRYAYPLPPDFLRLIPNTEHRGGWPLGLIGPASPQTWAFWLHGGGAAPVQAGWRIANNAIFIEPTPAAAELIAIGYVSRYPVVSDVQEGDYDKTTNPPTCISPFVPRDGHMDLGTLDATDTIEGAAAYDQIPGWDVGVFGEEISEALKRINPLSGAAPMPQVRRPEFTADTDVPAFDDDHLLSLGMTFRLRRGLGLDFSEEAAEYETEMDQKLAHDAGGARQINLGCDDRNYDAVPLGNGRWLVS